MAQTVSNLGGPPNMNKIMGYDAALILKDEHGEFQVRNAIGIHVVAGTAVLRHTRILAAITARERAMAPKPPARPVY